MNAILSGADDAKGPQSRNQVSGKPSLAGNNFSCGNERCGSAKGKELGSLGMAEELAFKDEAAAEYDLAFAHVTAHFHARLCITWKRHRAGQADARRSD